MTNNDTAIQAPRRLARPIPKKEDFAPFDFTKANKAKNHRRGPRKTRKIRTIL